MPLLIFSLLLGLASASVSVPANPITGETQPEPAVEPAGPLTLQDPSAPAIGPSFDGDAAATVIEFSILPSASDPNKMETIIILQQGGGRSICVTQNEGDIISRGYRTRGDVPFNPTVPNEIRGLSSGHSGEFMGFNDFKVFIRPHSESDDFSDTNECFQVADAEACFVADGEDCDQVLREGDALCVGGGTMDSSCAVTGHADLMRKLRIIVALNQPAGETPIITAAGLAAATELALQSGEPGAPGGGLPAGAAPAGPTAGDDFGGGSGGGINLVVVPNVIGLPFALASDTIIGADLLVGTVVIQGQQAGLNIPSLIPSAQAQAPCEPNTVFLQTPNGGVTVVRQSFVNLVLCPQAAAIPEPSSLALFATGLGLLILFTWSRRRLR